MTEYFEHGEEPAVVEQPSVTSIFLELPPPPKEIPKKVLFYQPPECATFMFRKAKKKPPKIVITYDRDEIRKKIDRLTFAQARRLMPEIYQPVIDELYEEASPCWAEHFSKLFEKEKDLKENEVINETLNENRKLLAMLLDKIKLSDKALQLKSTKKYGYQHLHDIMILLEPYRDSFDWLIKDMYSIIANMCIEAEDLDNGCYEILSKVFLKYSIYLDSMKELEEAQFWIEKAFKLARGELWPADSGECNLTLHEYLAPVYSDILLKQAKILITDNFETAFELTNKAILVLCEVGIEKFNKQFCKAHLIGGSLLTANHNFEKALEFLYRIEEKIHENDEDLELMFSEYYYTLGICFMNLQLEEKALDALQIAITAARKFEQRKMEAMILLVIGQLINIHYKDRCTAIHTFQQSAEIFKDIGDAENEKRTKYLLATLQSEIIFPYFMDLLKGIEDENICATYQLRQWKDLCTPFWIDIPVDFLKPVDPLHCLLKEDA